MKAENLNSKHFVLDPKVTADLRVKIKQDPQGGLKLAAQQFEGMLLQMMLKSMRDASPQDGLMDNDQSRYFTSILDQQMAQDLSAQGRLGFAKLIEQQLGRNMSSGSSFDPVAALAASQQRSIQLQAANYAVSSGGGAEHVRSTSAMNNEPAVAGASASSSDFVNRIWPHAVEASSAIGVPPQFLVAHSALESAWGKSEIRNTNGSPTYNLFGVKAGRNWQGPSVEVQTTEYVNGVAQTSREKFRVYGSYAESFRDYTNLLLNNPRYSEVLGQKDGVQFSRSLQQSGYATDPMYADKLSRIISGATLRQALAG